MDEEVREWARKKAQEISEGGSVLSAEPMPTAEPMPAPAAAPTPAPEELAKVEKKKPAEEKAKRPIEQPPIKGSVDVEEKIAEYLEEAGAVKEMEVKQAPPVEEPQPPEEPPQPMKEQRRISKMHMPKMPKISAPKLKLPKLLFPKPSAPKLLEPEPSRLPGPPKVKPVLFNKRRILIAIISSVAGIVAGYLLLQFLIK